MSQTSNLLALAGQCSTLAADLLTHPRSHARDVAYLAQSLLKMAGELVECSFKADPYLWHVQITCWEGVNHWRKWLGETDLTPEQDAAYQTIDQAWNDLLDGWDDGKGAA